jgi:hypothetical protein
MKKEYEFLKYLNEKNSQYPEIWLKIIKYFSQINI